MKENKTATISARITPSEWRILAAIATIRNLPINTVIQLLVNYGKNILIPVEKYEEFDKLITEFEKKGD